MNDHQSIASGIETPEQPHDGNRKVQPLVRNLDQKNFKNYGINATDDMITIIDWDSFDDTLPHDELSMTPEDLIEFCKFILDANRRI